MSDRTSVNESTGTASAAGAAGVAGAAGSPYARRKIMLAFAFIIIMIILLLSKDVSRGVLYVSLFTQFLIISTYLTTIVSEYTATDEQCPHLQNANPVDISDIVPPSGLDVAAHHDTAPAESFEDSPSEPDPSIVGQSLMKVAGLRRPNAESEVKTAYDGGFDTLTYDPHAAQALLTLDMSGGQHTFLQEAIAAQAFGPKDTVSGMSDANGSDALYRFGGLDVPQRLHYVRGDGYFPIEYANRQLQASKRTNLEDDDMDEEKYGHWVNNYRDELAYAAAKKKGVSFFSAYGDYTSPYDTV